MYVIMVNIVPITEMRNTTKMFELSENEPVYITKNGYGSRVLMNIQTYNYIKELLLDVQLEEYYQRSEVDGRNVDANEFLKRLMNE
jgi:PHD/YefM family antitoxin component YafN of YafNO toxin-antitoxin module